MKVASVHNRRLVSAIGAVAMASLLIVVFASAASADDGSLASQIGKVRAATARFQRVETAQAEGYAQFLGCISEPGQGAMGIHFVNGNFVGDTVLDPLRPEAVIYEPQANGRLKLVALEYIVFAAAWRDQGNNAPPTLLGQTMKLVGSPNRYGLPPFYELHLWAWKHNPSGMFNDWNPTVTCAAASAN